MSFIYFAGTFEAEKEEEKVVYGLVHNIDSWEPVHAQVYFIILDFLQPD
jgi:hypothetical protein